MSKQLKLSNRTVYITERHIVLKSYDTYIASISKTTGRLRLTDAWYYSRTTWDHLRKFIKDYDYFLNPTLRYTLGHMLDEPTLYHGPTVIRTLIDCGDITSEDERTLQDQAQER